MLLIETHTVYFKVFCLIQNIIFL